MIVATGFRSDFAGVVDVTGGYRPSPDQDVAFTRAAAPVHAAACG